MKKKAIIISLFFACSLLVACGADKSETSLKNDSDISDKQETAIMTAPEALPTPEPTPTPVQKVTILGDEYELDTERLDLSDIKPEEVEKTAEAVSKLTELRYIELVSEEGVCALTPEEIAPLAASAPSAEIGCSFELFGQTATNETVELRYEKLKCSGEELDGVFRPVLPYLKSLKLLRIGRSSIDNDVMDRLRNDFPDVQIVWSVFFADHYWMTDTTLINSTLLNDNNTDNLKYMHDVLYVDIGHDRTIQSLDFVRNFPKLQAIIISLTTISDISPLADCHELEFVETFSTRVADLTPLAGLSKLEYLNIGNNYAITDISPLFGLSNLKLLRICDERQITDEQIEEARSCLPNCEINTYGGHSANSGHWRFNDDGTKNERYTLLREQMEYDKPWEERQSNSPSA